MKYYLAGLALLAVIYLCYQQDQTENSRACGGVWVEVYYHFDDCVKAYRSLSSEGQRLWFILRGGQ